MALCVKMFFQTLVLVLVYTICDWFVALTDCFVPANVLGIVVLFALLCAGVVKENWIQEACSFFLRHLVFFFIAVGVALINWGGVFYEYGLVLALALLASTVLPFCAVGILMQNVMKSSAKEDD